MIVALAAVIAVGAAILAWKLGSGANSVPSLLAQSLFFGCLDALFAVGIVVIYRASRVINFAHGGIWVVAYTVFWELIGFHGISYQYCTGRAAEIRCSA